MKTLVVTNRFDDAHADEFFRVMRDRNDSSAIRLNTDNFIANSEVCFDGVHFNIKLKDSGINFSSDDISVVWYRRPIDVEPLQSTTDFGLRDFAANQASAFLRSLYFSIQSTATWINPLEALHSSRHKLAQLKLAVACGFLTPKTLATNSSALAGKFFDTNDSVCVKSLDEPNFTDGGKLRPLLTSKVSKSFFDANQESVSACPTFFQELVPKSADIRVIVFGQDIYAFLIASQNHPSAVIDFRGAAPFMLRHEVHTLPPLLEERIRYFMRCQGLVFGALDFVLTPEGDYIFIENNPNGQWLWLERETQFPLMDLFIKFVHRFHHV